MLEWTCFCGGGRRAFRFSRARQCAQNVAGRTRRAPALGSAIGQHDMNDPGLVDAARLVAVARNDDPQFAITDPVRSRRGMTGPFCL
jgi:hypothetical protein